jgi:hypothetical protein
LFRRRTTSCSKHGIVASEKKPGNPQAAEKKRNLDRKKV